MKTASELITILLASGGGILVLLLTLIQIAPIKVNPWSWLAKKLGKAINGDVAKRVDDLSADVEALRSECEEQKITACRTRILRFGDELLYGIKHSKEHFEQILRDVDAYEAYCAAHPGFQNNVALEAIRQVKERYRVCIERNSFLQPRETSESKGKGVETVEYSRIRKARTVGSHSGVVSHRRGTKAKQTLR